MEEYLPILCALASRTRLSIIQSLQKEKGTTGKKLSELTGIQDQTISDHLSILHESGIVQKKRSGREVYFFLSNEKLLGEVFLALDGVIQVQEIMK